MDRNSIIFDFNNELKFTGSQLLSDPQGLATIEYQLITEESVDGIGEVELGTVVSPRTFELDFEVPRNQADGLHRYFQANKNLILTIGDRKINCKCTRAVIDNKDGYFIDPVMHLEFTASDPYFYSTSDFGKNLAGIKPMFKFPYVVTKNKPLVIGYKLFSERSIFTNNGDRQVGLTAVFQATRGEATNIKFTNLKTGKYIKINNLTMEQGDKVTISTVRGSKSVIKFAKSTGESESIFKDVDRLSDFFYLDVGENLLKYEADLGQTNVDVYLYYTPVYSNGWSVTE